MKRIMSGNIVRIIKPIRSTPANGADPFTTSSKERFVIPLITNKFIPTGGVIIPISTQSVETTPKKIGSNPSVVRAGKTKGMVTTTILTGSIKQPSISKRI